MQKNTMPAIFHETKAVWEEIGPDSRLILQWIAFILLVTAIKPIMTIALLIFSYLQWW